LRKIRYIVFKWCRASDCIEEVLFRASRLGLHLGAGRGRETGKKVGGGRKPPPPPPPNQSFKVERAGGVAKGVASKRTNRKLDFAFKWCRAYEASKEFRLGSRVSDCVVQHRVSGRS
jgi:hypothetical protein